MIIEGRKERNSKSAIGHCVQQTVAGGGRENVEEQRQSSNYAHISKDKCYYPAQQRGKEQRMREAAMAPEVPVVDAETKADCVQVWNDRTQGTHDPDTLGSLRPVKARSDTECRDRV